MLSYPLRTFGYGSAGVPEAPSPTSYRRLEILLAGLQLFRPRISYSTSWFRSPLHWDAESLLHQDDFNSLIARLLERRKASPSPRARLLRHLRLLCAPSRLAGPGRFPGPWSTRGTRVGRTALQGSQDNHCWKARYSRVRRL